MRLIDADKAIEELQEQMKTATNPLFAMLCDQCIAHLEKQPTFSIETHDKCAKTHSCVSTKNWNLEINSRFHFQN